VRPAASEVERLLAGTALARGLWGWQPRYSLEQGIDETIAWVERNLHRFRVDAYTM
jgi:dTDP-glucose 4,6-dehydratase